MEKYSIHSIESAPEGSKILLQETLKRNGHIPNLHGIMAESPVLLKAYTELGNLFGQTSFTVIEKQIIWLTVSYVHQCHYCMAVHTAIAIRYKTPAHIITALRMNTPIDDPKFESLRLFTKHMIEKRGFVSADDVEKFFNAGYSKQHIMELLVGIVHKTLSNYINHIAETPLDSAFSEFQWTNNTP